MMLTALRAVASCEQRWRGPHATCSSTTPPSSSTPSAPTPTDPSSFNAFGLASPHALNPETPKP
eukprot:2407646-Rhodomonas_salina.1